MTERPRFSPYSDNPFGDIACGYSETMQRAAVVAAARTWLGTTYHHNAAVKGAGVDCGRILIESFAEAGLIESFDPGYYAPDWHKHRGEERYREVIEGYCPRVDDDERSILARGTDFTALPGDILMWRLGRTYSHSALVSAWPRVIHSAASEGMALETEIFQTTWPRLPMMVFSFWSKPDGR